MCNQDLSILFWLKRARKSADGKVPISIRVTIDGKKAEISLSRKVHPDYWDEKTKQVSGNDPEYITPYKVLPGSEAYGPDLEV